MHSRADGRLELPKTPLSIAHMSAILTHCSPLVLFSWKTILDRDMANLLTNKFTGSLRSFTVCAVYPVLESVLSHCGRSLRCLDIDCTFLAHCPLALIANTCPHLVELALNSCLKTTSDDVVALFNGCPELKELAIGVASVRIKRAVLHSLIVREVSQLRLLKLMNNFNKTDAMRSRELASLHQLPFPAVVVLNGL